MFDVLRAQELANLKYGWDTTTMNTNTDNPTMLHTQGKIKQLSDLLFAPKEDWEGNKQRNLVLWNAMDGLSNEEVGNLRDMIKRLLVMAAGMNDLVSENIKNLVDALARRNPSLPAIVLLKS